MPVFAGGEDQRVGLRRSFDDADRRGQDTRFDRAPLGVQVVEAMRQQGGERRVVGRQQAGADCGIKFGGAGADPTAGIDPRIRSQSRDGTRRSVR